MIYKSNSNISKLNSARKITAGMVIITMLVCGLFCFLGGMGPQGRAVSYVSAEGAYKPVVVEISFECLKNAKLSKGSYTICISPTEEGYPLPEHETIEVVNGNGSFFLTITEPGSYTYLVYQVKGEHEDIIYDETVYEIHISVMNKDWDTGNEPPADGQTELIYYMSVNYAGTDKKPMLIEFENEPGDGGGTGVTGGTTEDTTEETSENTSDSSDDSTTEKSDGDNAKTGDSTNVGLVVLIMSLSLGAVVILFLLKRSADKKHEDEEDVDDGKDDV